MNNKHQNILLQNKLKDIGENILLFEKAVGQEKINLGRKINTRLDELVFFYNPYGHKIDFFQFYSIKQHENPPLISTQEINNYSIATYWYGIVIKKNRNYDNRYFVSELSYSLWGKNHKTLLLHSSHIDHAKKFHWNLLKRANKINNGFEYDGLDCYQLEHYINSNPLFQTINFFNRHFAKKE